MKGSIWLAGCGASLFVLSLATSSLGGTTGGDLPKQEWKRGLAIAPVQLNLQGKNRMMVGLGSYIVNGQGGCNDCHTNPSYAPGGNPFMGEPEQINATNYLAGGAQFGPFRSRNLTPNGQGLPAGMTLAEFMNTLRTGRDLAGQTLQVMPWPVYGKMTDKDIKAVYEYLRSIPHAEPADAMAR